MGSKEKKKQGAGNLPMILVILDGWGIADPSKGNAITLAKTPYIDSLYKKYPNTKICASGKCVGLPTKQDGNSEAGHMNIGAGRLVEQDAVRIGHSINTGIFFQNTAFIEALEHAKEKKSKIHIMGMLSNGMSAHSDPDHLLAIIEFLKNHKVKDIYLHLFTDGRDSPKYTALDLVKNLQKTFKNGEKISTIMGRFYAMDRKKKWERTKIAYDSLILGNVEQAETAEEAIQNSYNKGDGDEFIKPCVIGKTKKEIEESRIGDNDTIIFFNLRSDRARQLAKVFVQEKFNASNPKSFKRSRVLKDIYFVAMTDFGPDLGPIVTAFPGIDLKWTLPMVLHEFSQLYIAETEKYAHVTYFFNGGYAGTVNGEDQYMLVSKDVKYYDEVPEMKSKELASTLIKNVENKKYDFTVVNFAAPDMIGHTGNLKAGIKCCEIIDAQVKRLVEAYLKAGGTVLITADHGNIEEMIEPETGAPNGEHTSNPVPFIVINDKLKKRIKLKEDGKLADIAPTIIYLLGKDQPRDMTGMNLIY